MKENIMILFLGIFSFTICQASNSNLKPIETTHSNYSPAYLKCRDENISPNECIEKELKVQDKQLNIAYQKARKSIQPFRVDTLKEIQQTWIDYRDAKCNFFYHKESGSGGLTDLLQCKLDATILRTNELKALY